MAHDIHSKLSYLAMSARRYAVVDLVRGKNAVQQWNYYVCIPERSSAGGKTAGFCCCECRREFWCQPRRPVCCKIFADEAPPVSGAAWGTWPLQADYASNIACDDYPARARMPNRQRKEEGYSYGSKSSSNWFSPERKIGTGVVAGLPKEPVSRATGADFAIREMIQRETGRAVFPGLMWSVILES